LSENLKLRYLEKNIEITIFGENM